MFTFLLNLHAFKRGLKLMSEHLSRLHRLLFMLSFASIKLNISSGTLAREEKD
jgi:hypothetical protein